MTKINLYISLLILFTLVFPSSASAQTTSPDKPVYVVQKNDTLNAIAIKFNISVKDLIDANGITNPNSLVVGQKLVIPGLPAGVSGTLTTVQTVLGDTLDTLSRQKHVSADLIIQLNHITSPAELFAGANLIIPQKETGAAIVGQTILGDGQTFLEAAVLANQNPWKLKQENELKGVWQAIPGGRLFYQDPNAGGVGLIRDITISPLPLIQGKTTEIKVVGPVGLTITGALLGKELHFFNMSEGGIGEYVALQGVHAMAKPGLQPISIKVQSSQGTLLEFEQLILVKSGNYPDDPPLFVDPVTLDPAVTKPEDNLVAEKTQPYQTARAWTGKFRAPVDEPICIKSWYGDRRSYNNSAYTYYHTGLDYGVCANLNIYAPAPGVVVFVGPLTVRGNATIVDHGWGIYSGFYHQKEILVKVGDQVKAGQVIGLMGATGRVNGPHLHWDLFVNGIQADPEDWLDESYP